MSIESILASDYPKDRLEILVVDGRSDNHAMSIECPKPPVPPDMARQPK